MRDHWCAWCGDRVEKMLIGGNIVWTHTWTSERQCFKQVGPAAFVRSVTFYATPFYAIDVPFPDA